MRSHGWPILLAAAGCSLIHPLDDLIGEPAAAGQGGSVAGAGGFDPTGGKGSAAGGFGGEDDGGAPYGGRSGGSSGVGGTAGSAGSAGSGSGGRAGDGGSSGDDEPGGMNAGGEGGAGDGGVGGASGTSGGGVGGVGGASGAGNAGTGGGGSGGKGGSAGMGGNGGCAGANLMANPDHCGACWKTCSDTETCRAGECVEPPCAGLCTSPTTVALANGEFKVGGMGTEEPGCFEVMPDEGMLISEVVCWGFVPRTLRVNDVALTGCATTGNFRGPAPPRRNGGYCAVVGPGQLDWAGFTLPLDD
jgi:hypothetical protein